MPNSHILAARLVAQTATDLSRLDANGDGEITAMEVFSVVSGTVLRGYSVYREVDFAELREVLSAEGSDERDAAVEEFRQTLDLPDDAIEEAIEEALDLVEDLYSSIVEFADRAKAIRALVRDRDRDAV